jgi:uncharacterized protein
LRFLIRLDVGLSPKDGPLQAIRSIASSFGLQVRNPKWTSGGSLELDVFSPTRDDFDLLVSALTPLYPLDFIRDLNASPPFKTEDEQFEEARAYFNDERFWETHEVLEALWRQRSGPEKLYLQGLILLCAAFVHHQKGEPSVALGVLRRAVPQLTFTSSNYHGFEVEKILESARSILRTGDFRPFKV